MNPTMKPFGPAWHTSLATPHKGRYLSESEICHCCGKPTKSPKLMVYVNIEVGVFVTQEEVDEDKFDYAFYPVGSECAKKFKAAGVTVYPAKEVWEKHEIKG